MSSSDEPAGESPVTAALQLIITVAYLAYSYYEVNGGYNQNNKARFYYHAGRATEKATNFFWDLTIRLRRSYRREVL
jgi:hypothetical protein